MTTEGTDPVAGQRVGPFTTTGVVPELEAMGLSGGAFGLLTHALHVDGSGAVVKLCRPAGGGRSNTLGVGFHHPDIGYSRGAHSMSPRHFTLGLVEVADALRQEAVVLEQAGGILLPAYLGLFEYTPPGRETPLPALAMEHIWGHRPLHASELVRVLESLADASESGHLDTTAT